MKYRLDEWPSSFSLHFIGVERRPEQAERGSGNAYRVSGLPELRRLVPAYASLACFSGKKAKFLVEIVPRDRLG